MMRRGFLLFGCLTSLMGCTDPDSRAGLQRRWEADSAKYAGFDCRRVPLGELDECRRVNRAYARPRVSLAEYARARASLRDRLESAMGVADSVEAVPAESH